VLLVFDALKLEDYVLDSFEEELWVLEVFEADVFEVDWVLYEPVFCCVELVVDPDPDPCEALEVV
jgi:hypothetical protein